MNCFNTQNINALWYEQLYLIQQADPVMLTSELRTNMADKAKVIQVPYSL